MNHRIAHYLLVMLITLASYAPGQASNSPPTQLFYIPFAEDHQLTAFKSINGVSNDPLAVFVTFSAATEGTVIYYDHWEDGYEDDITNPVQSTTLIFGDGDPSNGYPPGNPSDLIPAGTVFNLRNFVNTTTLQSVLDFDARDKVATYKPISLTKTTFPTGTNTLLAGCVEVFEYGLWGTEYRAPVGVDMPTSTASGNLTFDENLFSHNSISIMAGPGGATVQIDKDNNGVFEETVVLAEGETIYRDEVNVGGHVLSDKPVQVVLFNGTVGSNYASRDTMMLPTYRWSSDYFCPVTTRTLPADGTVTFLYNPGSTDITVNYDYRNSASTYVTNTINVPAGGNARVVMQPAGTGHFGAYRFYTTGSEPPIFYAFSAIDADAASGGNQAWDGGFTLVGRPSLTTQVLVSLGIGRDPYSATNPNENANPIWVTSVGNGHAIERIYVDYNGDNAGPLTDPNGNKYDVHYDVRELEQLKLFDPDGDQSGMLVYSLNPSVRIAAVWGQDPALAAAGQPGLDVASLIPPLREGDAGKKSSVKNDADGDGFMSAGDTLEIDIRAVSNARATIPGPFNFQDNLPADLAYVPGSTRYRYSVGGNWQAWVVIPDDGSGTPFPLDGSGYPVPGNLLPGQQIQVVFDAVVANYEDLTSGTIHNTGLVEISPYGLLLPIQWTDTIYGSISDTVWNDINGDGIQDPGENGLPGVRVWADLNNNGMQDSGEPSDTTDSNGNYLLGGLVAGTYTVRVNPSDIAAINVGFGPSYDLDGVATSHVAIVVLAAAEQRVDADFGYRVGASVGDRVWMDRNNNRLQGAGEPGINGVRVYIDSNGNGSYDVGEPNTITSGDGDYYIGNLDPGTYTVRVDTSTLPTGASQTHDLNGALDHAASVTLIAAEHRADLDFGYRGTLSIGDLVWEDVDGNGIRLTYNIIDGRIDINNSGTVSGADDGFIGGVQIIDGYVDINGSGAIGGLDDGVFQGITVIDGGLDVNNSGSVTTSDDLAAGIVGEFGIANVRVYIDSNGNGSFDTNEPSAVTNANGIYSIGNLFNGTYTVRVDTSTLPSSFVPTYDLTSPTGDHTATVTLSGSSRTDVDFGYRNDASLGDLVWNDRNNNGIRDAGEPGMPGVLVYIDANSNGVFDPATERSAITDLDGYYFIDNLPAGTFLVRVDISTLPQGSTQTYDLDGLGTPHRASRTLTVSQDATDVDFGYRANAAFGDFVWNDLNGNGIHDSGETGIVGVRVYADINGDGVFDSATEPSATTDSNGFYTIGNLVPGTYTARVDTSTLPVGMVQTYDLVGALDHASTFFVSANQTRTDLDFGYTMPISIGDFVWNDVNGNGRQDNGETGIAGVSITAFNAANDTIVATTISASDGSYSFLLMPGSYYLVFDTPQGYARTLPNQGNDTGDSDIDLIDGKSHTVALTGGQSNLTIDAGFYQPGTVFGHLYIDTNGNGTQDSGEPDLADVDVIVTDAHGNIQTVTTDSNGDWSAAVPPGNTSAKVDETDPEYPTGYTQTEGTDPTVVVAIANSNINAGIDGYFLPGSISGTVWIDTDDDGDGDSAFEGVLLSLLDASGIPVLDGLGDPITMLTGPVGTYVFTNLPPGNYSVVQDQPSNYNSVSDTDGANNNIIGDETPIEVIAGQNNGGNDFVEIELGSISGFVRIDTDDDGDGDAPFAGVVLHLLDSSGNSVLDSSNNPIQAVTQGDGSYIFTLVPTGTYRVSQTQPAGYGSVSDVDGANNNVIGDETPIVMTPGLVVTGRDFVEIELGAISGTVFKDTNNDGNGDTVFSGVLLSLLDGDGDPVLDGLGNPVTATTAVDGTYRFDDLMPGDYQVAQSQPANYGSVSDADNGDLDLIGNITPISVGAGEEITGRDFVEIELGTISGYVRVGSDPLSGVTLTLLDENGATVDGDPNTPGVQPITTVTDSQGYYQFTGVRPGIYQVGQTQPFGYESFADADGGDLNIVGDQIPINLLPGDHSEENNFIEIIDTCPDNWEEWKHQHPGEQPSGNPDLDAYDNFAEFAFAMPYDNGTGSPWLGSTAWIIQASTLNPDTLEGVFIRPKGAYLNVVYTLQYAPTPDAPITWLEIEIDSSNSSVDDNGDCTETVTIHDLENFDGFTPGTGIVRIKAELDDDGGNDEVDHTSFTEPEGWKETTLGTVCSTYNNPYLRETAFTGIISAVNGQDIEFAISAGDADLTDTLTAGNWFIEVISGPLEGQRFDVISAANNTLTLANDANLHSVTPPFNTLLGAPPLSLVGNTVALRRHWTLDELFPPYEFTATDNRNTADQVQLFAGGAWTIFWLYDDGILPVRWVRMGDNTYANQGGSILAPGFGMFVNNRGAQQTILAYGEVRTNDFIRPLAAGNNLIGGGYPLAQSATGAGSRSMSVASGFFGSRDFSTADSIFLWQADSNIASTGYDTYYLLDNTPRVPLVQRWVKAGDANLIPRDSELLMLQNRSVFLRSMNGLNGYTMPSLWTP